MVKNYISDEIAQNIDSFLYASVLGHRFNNTNLSFYAAVAGIGYRWDASKNANDAKALTKESEDLLSTAYPEDQARAFSEYGEYVRKHKVSNRKDMKRPFFPIPADYVPAPFTPPLKPGP